MNNKLICIELEQTQGLDSKSNCPSPSRLCASTDSQPARARPGNNIDHEGIGDELGPESEVIDPSDALLIERSPSLPIGLCGALNLDAGFLV